jgi:hypothetical protein
VKAITAIVAFRSLHWMRVGLGSYLQAFPDERVLVVDNNYLPGERGWDRDCDTERAWLAGHPSVDLVDRHTPWGVKGNHSHGAGIEAALGWCRRRGADVLLHIEPDCLISGRVWRDNLLDAINRGAWMAASRRLAYGALHPTPSAWRLDQAWDNFDGHWMVPADLCRPRFAELVDLVVLQAEIRNWAPPTGWATGTPP